MASTNFELHDERHQKDSVKLMGITAQDLAAIQQKANEDNFSDTENNGVEYVQNPNAKYFWAICIVSAVLILAAGATLAALYAPEHMPDAISKIVEGLSTVAFYGITGGAAVAGVAGVTGLGVAFYNNNKTDGGVPPFVENTSSTTVHIRSYEPV